MAQDASSQVPTNISEVPARPFRYLSNRPPIPLLWYSVRTYECLTKVVSLKVCRPITPIRISKMVLPAEIYSVARNFAKDFRNYIMEQSIEFLEKKGYYAVSGKISEAYTLVAKKDFYSTWSENHIAFAAGLGTFSLHEGLITTLGCNIRLASVVTNAPLKITKRKSENPYGNCLYYSKGTCRKCEERCPGNAIDENGHDKNKCYEYGQKVARKIIARIGPILKPHIRSVNGKLRPPSFPVGCAFCQFGVPCMDRNPTLKT